MFKIILWAFFCLFFVTIDGIQVTILHYNDLEGQLTAFEKGTDPPRECMSQDSCLGGLGRIAHVINQEYEKDKTKTIRIQAGNFVGSYWMSTLSQSWHTFGHFMTPLEVGLNTSSALVPDIIALGMQEFGAGLTQTKSFINAINNSNIVLTNVDCSAESDFCSHVVSSRVVQVSSAEYRIPFVGFMNPRVQQLSEPGNLTFPDIVTSLTEEIFKTHGSEKHVIAVGQGSLSIAKEIIDKIPRVKIVVFSGGINDLEGYPLQYNGGVIVKVPKYGGSIGRLTFEYDVNGKISNFAGNLIPIGTGVTLSDKVVDDTIKVLSDAIIPLMSDEIGKTAVELQWNRDCWKKECNLGNLVTDAMVKCAYNITETDPAKIPYGIMAFWHSGAIHDDIYHFQETLYAIDPHKWFPFHNRPVYVQITGDKLWKIFERSATGLGSQADPDWGQFLQVSKEIRVTYRQTGDNRYVLDDLRAFGKENEDSNVPTYFSVKDHPGKMFEAIIPSFIFNGRSVYNDIFQPGDKLSINVPVYDDQCVENYIRGEHILRNGFEERIFFGDNSSSKCKGSNTAVTVTLTLLIFIFICGIAFLGFRYGYQGWWARRNHQQF